jgi:putative membrane protein
MPEPGDDLASDDPRRPLDPRDYSRRTLLANERTYLAWWRTGLTTLTVALGAARVVPELADTRHQWAYTAVGVAFAVVGVVCIAYGERRRRAVDAAVRQGAFAPLDGRMSAAITAAGVVLGVLLIVLILADS